MRLPEAEAVWQAGAARPQPEPRSPCILQADFVIVGAGIIAAFLAERLTRTSASVVVIARHAPTSGSTVASTVMLFWKLDSSLLEPEQCFGALAAARIGVPVNISGSDAPKDGAESAVPGDRGLGKVVRPTAAQRPAGKPIRLSRAMNVGFRK